MNVAARRHGPAVLLMSSLLLVSAAPAAKAASYLSPEDGDASIDGEATASLPKPKLPPPPEPPAAQPGNEAETVNARATAPAKRARLPIFGLGLDVGLPDGANLSLVARPCPWARLHMAMGNNGISFGWRTGAAVLPFREGPALVVEYGRYGDGNANLLAGKLLGSGYRANPAFDHLSYDYLNLHLGLNFGIRRVVFFVQGGLSILRGELHDVNQAAQSATAGLAGTEVTVHANPTVKLTGFAAKLGVIAYAW